MTTTTTIIPYGNRILIAIPEGIESEIILPDASKAGHVPYWEVLAVGDDVKRLKAGDFVLIDPGAMPVGVNHEGREALLCYEVVVIAKVDADK